jgi:phosphate:Na+ symporter
METFSWSILLGGFAFFFLGLRSARKSLQLVAGDRLRAALGRVASNRVIALFFGAFITMVLQSSGATSVMLVSFAETQLLTLGQAIAVMLGADIGTTFTVVLLSIQKITQYALLVVAVGFLVQIAARSRKTRNIGGIILGFGLIFYGMHLMSQSAVPLKESEVAVHIFAFLAGHPLASLVIAVVISGAIHSAAMIGIAIALAFAGTLTFEASIPIILGANIGTCITAILAGFGSGIEGRRVALAHTASKVIGVAVVFPFIPQVARFVNFIDTLLADIVPAFATTVAAKIAITHILFNTALAIVFLPLISVLVKLVTHIIPTPPGMEEKFGPKYLDKSSLGTPAIAFAQVKREIMRVAEIANTMVERCLKMFSRGTDAHEEIELTQADDDKIDILEKAVRFYLAKLGQDGLSTEQVRVEMSLLTIVSDLEDIGDTISREMVMLARKKAHWRRLFSDEGWKDLRDFQSNVQEHFELTLSMLAQPSEEIHRTVIRHEDDMNKLEQEYRQAHLNRLHEGLQESFDTSSLHLDILSNLRRVSAKLTHIVTTMYESHVVVQGSEE